MTSTVTRRARTSRTDAIGAELRADTKAGAEMVATAEWLAGDFAAAAARHDRDGTFAAEHLERLRRERFLVAPIPSELGGGGVRSVHDVVVAMSRLARGDVSTAIGVSMHLVVVQNIVRRWRIAVARGEEAQARSVNGYLRIIAACNVVFASVVSEPAPQDFTRPATRAERVSEGWRVDGRKVFATMAPAARLLNVAVTYRAADGSERYGFAAVPTSAPGVRFAGDWDALGMRASDSGSVTFDDVRIGPGDLHDGFPAGRWTPALLERFLAAGAFHAASSLGIAEAAHLEVMAALRGRAAATLADPHAVVRLGENVADLASMRATLDRAVRLVDEHHAAHPTGEPSLAESQAVFGEVQAAKLHLNETATRVVDRALALSGGAGYMAAHPLARAWRDVRAGAFMHPLGANRAYELLARTALGVEPG
jgi:L-evernosamine nitrososynthase